MATLTTLNAASPLDASDNTYLTFTQDVTETLNRAVDNTDADFGTMDTLTYNVEYSVTTTPTDDTYQLEVRIVSGATILAAADAGGTPEVVASNITSTTDANSGAVGFTYVNTAADKTTWDAATVELTQTYAKTKGADTSSIRVDHVIFDGTYTAGVTTNTINTSLDGVLQKELTISSSLDSALQKGFTVSSSLDGVLQKEFTVSTVLDGVLQKELTISSSLDSALQKELTISTSLDASLALPSSSITISTSIDGSLQKEFTVSSSLDGVLQKEFTAPSSLDGVLQKEFTASSSLDGVLQKEFTLSSSLDAHLIILSSNLVSTSLDSALQKEFTALVGLDAELIIPINDVSTSLDAVISRVPQYVRLYQSFVKISDTVSTSLDSTLQKEFTVSTSLDAVLLKAIETSLDSALKKRFTTSTGIDAVILRVPQYVRLYQTDVSYFPAGLRPAEPNYAKNKISVLGGLNNIEIANAFNDPDVSNSLNDIEVTNTLNKIDITVTPNKV